MLKVYGSMLCKDCVQCRKAFDKLGVEYVYLDFEGLSQAAGGSCV